MLCMLSSKVSSGEVDDAISCLDPLTPSPTSLDAIGEFEVMSPESVWSDLGDRPTHFIVFFSGTTVCLPDRYRRHLLALTRDFRPLRQQNSHGFDVVSEV